MDAKLYKCMDGAHFWFNHAVVDAAMGRSFFLPLASCSKHLCLCVPGSGAQRWPSVTAATYLARCPRV